VGPNTTGGARFASGPRSGMESGVGMALPPRRRVAGCCASPQIRIVMDVPPATPQSQESTHRLDRELAGRSPARPTKPVGGGEARLGPFCRVCTEIVGAAGFFPKRPIREVQADAKKL
jgi:hypothetical protein